MTDTFNQEDKIHNIKSTAGYNFIVSNYEAKRILNRIQHTKYSLESLCGYGDVVLISRIELAKYVKKGYKSLQVLDQNDRFLWMCRAEHFKETVVNSVNLEGLAHIKDIDRDILKGQMTMKLARQLLK
ncbi:hypothetical protein ACIGHG_22775 [Bacillus sp. NPDC077411]|uniref:hypothetical protein n=1 Tax=Bacillus sp. NPDC077411 TaxID=3363947 RepID=UPI0037C628BA